MHANCIVPFDRIGHDRCTISTGITAQCDNLFQIFAYARLNGGKEVLSIYAYFLSKMEL
jgi:hypothetical protein